MKPLKRFHRAMLSLGEEIVERLKKHYSVEAREYVSLFAYLRSRDPYEVLIATILSQNTTDKAALQALERLEEKVGLTPSTISKARRKSIEAAIRVAGMYRSKARFLQETSRIIMSEYGGSMRNLLLGDPGSVRERIKGLPGVGDKTADVLLTTTGILQTVPIDTHVGRVAERLGLVRRGASYGEARASLEAVFREEHRHLAHLLLIAHGRRVCKARKPLCDDCPLTDLCKYYAEARGAKTA